MLFEIALVILPVFILVTIGFISSYIQLLTKHSVDGLTKFCQDFGIPFLLFFNLAILDLDKAISKSIISVLLQAHQMLVQRFLVALFSVQNNLDHYVS